MRSSFLYPVALVTALGLAACSPSSPSPSQGDPPTPKAAAVKAAPDSPVLGSPAWYTWVDQTLAISDDGHGPDQGSQEWNLAVQHKLGQEAPDQPVGTPQWQQAVDALLRTRANPS